MCKKISLLIIFILILIFSLACGIGKKNTPPTVKLTAVPYSVDAPLDYVFTAEATDSDGYIVKYEWDFNDDSIYDKSTDTNTVNYRFSNKNIFISQVRVTDNEGETAIASIKLNLNMPNLPPTVELVAAPGSGEAPLEVTFTAAASDYDGSIVNYEWDCNGDDIYEEDTNVNTINYIFQNKGVYAPKVRVTDNDGAIATATTEVKVLNNAPIANAGFDQYVTAGSQVTLDGTNSSDLDGDKITYKWSFISVPNGSDAVLYESDSTKSTFIADSTGVYSVKLTVIDNEGYNDFDTVEIIAFKSEIQVAYYPFNGNANDESGNGNHGTLYGAILAPDRLGNPNSAYSFDGVDDYIKINTININLPVTVIFWFKSDTINDIWDTIFGWNVPVYPYDGIQVCANGDGKIRFRMGSFFDDFVPDLKIDGDSKWHFLALSRDLNNELKVFIDGNKYTAQVIDPIASSEILYIGKSFQPDTLEEYFKGKIDDILIYNKVLSEAEIEAIYKK